MTKKLLRLLTVCFLSSCSHVDFDSSFSGEKSLDKFSPDLIGKYYYSDSFVPMDNDGIAYNFHYYSEIAKKRDSMLLISSEVTIGPTTATYSIDFISYFRISKFDTTDLISSRKTISGKKIVGEYLTFTETVQNTLVDLNTKDKLTLYDNKYYLNHFSENKASPQDSNNLNLNPDKPSWSIWQLEKINGSAYSINTTNREDYNVLFDTTKDWQPIFPIAHLTNKEFKKFIGKGGFRQKYRLTKYAH